MNFDFYLQLVSVYPPVHFMCILGISWLAEKNIFVILHGKIINPVSRVVVSNFFKVNLF